MPQVTFYFYKKNRLLNKLINYFTASDITHVAIGVDDFVYEAIGGRIFRSGILASPTATTQHEGKHKAEQIIPVKIEIPEDRYASGKDFLRSQVGKRYDGAGVISFIFRFIKHSKSRHYCSELANSYFELVTGTPSSTTKFSPGAVMDKVRAYKQGQNS